VTVIVPEPDGVGECEGRAHCRSTVQATVDYHRELAWENLLPGQDAATKEAK
jgi:hypothetical protein